MFINVDTTTFIILKNLQKDKKIANSLNEFAKKSKSFYLFSQ